MLLQFHYSCQSRLGTYFLLITDLQHIRPTTNVLSASGKLESCQTPFSFHSPSLDVTMVYTAVESISFLHIFFCHSSLCPINLPVSLFHDHLLHCHWPVLIPQNRSFPTQNFTSHIFSSGIKQLNFSIFINPKLYYHFPPVVPGTY